MADKLTTGRDLVPDSDMWRVRFTMELASLIHILEMNTARLERSNVPYLRENERRTAVERIDTLSKELFRTSTINSSTP